MTIIIRRNLPWGRESSALLQQDGADKIPDATRKAGYKANGNQAAVGEFMDQIAYEAQFDVVLGSASQLAIDAAQITWSNSNQRFENKLGAEVALGDYARVAVMGMDTLTSNIVIDNVVGLEMFHLGGTPQQTPPDPVFRMGDSGGGVPYKIFLGPNTNNCKLDILTDKPFTELPYSLSLTQRQYIANQGRANYIRVNGEEIYNPSLAGDIIKRDSWAFNPYLLRLNGALWPMSANVSVNGQAWFRDLNIALSGFFINGGVFTEYPSRFTASATLAATPYLFKVNIPNRFFSDITALDTRLHQRTDPTGAQFVATGAFNGTNTVTLSGLPTNTRPREGMRVQGVGVPSSPTATTLLRNYEESTASAKMYDALTGAPVNVATASGVPLTINNSGAAGGSHDNDYFQNITGSYQIRTGGVLSATPTGVYANTQIPGAGTAIQQLSNSPPNLSPSVVDFDASNSPSARAHDQTQPKSSDVYFYYRV